MAVQGISWGGIAGRVLIATLLVLVSYNPTGYSFYHWLSAPPPDITAIKALAGLILLIGWVICVRTAYISLGLLGLVLGGALLATLVWLIVDLKWIDPHNPGTLSWLVLAVLGVLLGVGLCWSLIRARLTGQIEAD